MAAAVCSLTLYCRRAPWLQARGVTKYRDWRTLTCSRCGAVPGRANDPPCQVCPCRGSDFGAAATPTGSERPARSAAGEARTYLLHGAPAGRRGRGCSVHVHRVRTVLVVVDGALAALALLA